VLYCAVLKLFHFDMDMLLIQPVPRHQFIVANGLTIIVIHFSHVKNQFVLMMGQD
jgi:hypothetical protein